MTLRVKMAKYHFLKNILQFITFFLTQFSENRVFHGTRVHEHELEYHKKFLKFFNVTRVHGTLFQRL